MRQATIPAKWIAGVWGLHWLQAHLLLGPEPSRLLGPVLQGSRYSKDVRSSRWLPDSDIDANDPVAKDPVLSDANSCAAATASCASDFPEHERGSGSHSLS